MEELPARARDTVEMEQPTCAAISSSLGVGVVIWNPGVTQAVALIFSWKWVLDETLRGVLGSLVAGMFLHDSLAYSISGRGVVSGLTCDANAQWCDTRDGPASRT